MEWPHLIHATLIWQQPHPVYLAETLYRLDPTGETLAEWKDVVFATAEYMADFMQLDTLRGKYVLAPPICPVSENTPIFETRNPTFELSYWRYGLETAQLWRERLGYGRLASWDDILGNMAPLPVQDSLYVTYEGIGDMWSRYNFEHPALAGIYGMLPGIGVDLETFRRTSAKCSRCGISTGCGAGISRCSPWRRHAAGTRTRLWTCCSILLPDSGSIPTALPQEVHSRISPPTVLCLPLSQ